MIAAIDTNVLIALWNPFDPLNLAACQVLDSTNEQGGLIISGAVYAELLGFHGRTEQMVEGFLTETGIKIDWTIDEPIWRRAAKAYQDYSKRRKKQKQKEPKRILTDFVVGAHAYERKYALLTLDNRIFKAAFPRLKIINA